MSGLDAVVFDFGIVLSSPPGLFDAHARALGVPASLIAQHYEEGRGLWDGGGPAEEYWGPFLERIGLTPTDDLIAQSVATDLAQWLPLRDEAHRILRDCRAAGHRVVVLSNAPVEMAAAMEGADWRADVDDLFVSGPLRLMKPDPEFYRLVAERVGARLAFIDDRELNVAAARELGWEAHLWVDDADTRAWLTELGILS